MPCSGVCPLDDSGSCQAYNQYLLLCLLKWALSSHFKVLGSISRNREMKSTKVISNPREGREAELATKWPCFLHSEECTGKQFSCLWHRVFLRAMSKRNNQKMIRISIENSILRYQLRKKHGSGNNALVKTETPPCSLLGVMLKKQGMKTQNAESDPESSGHTFYCSVYSGSTQKKLLFFFPFPVFLSCY